MGEIEKMKRYIEKTKIGTNSRSKYAMNFAEAFELAHQALNCEGFPVEIISLAFDYGKAKGYRAAKAEGMVKA